MAIGASYVLFLSRYVNASAGGADSSGYLSFGRLLASGRIFAPERTVPGYSLPSEQPYFYCPLGFKPTSSGRALVSNYPPGLPLMFAITSKIVGWERAATMVMITHCVFAIALMVVFCRLLGLSAIGTVCSTVVLAINPITLAFSVQPLSDVPAMAWTLLSVVLALQEKNRSSLVALSGTAFGIAFIVRPTCALILPSLVVLILLPLNNERLADIGRLGSILIPSARRIALFSVGGGPVLFSYFAFASRAYGHAFSTAYGDSGFLFSWHYVPPSLFSFLTNIPLLFSPIALMAPVCVCIRALNLRNKVAVIGPVLFYFGFYSSYFGTSENWWSLRFILPVAPMLISGGVLAFESFAPRLFWRQLARILPCDRPHISHELLTLCSVGVFLVAFSTHVIRFDRSFRFMNWGLADNEYRIAAEKLQALVPPKSICLCMQTSGSLYYYTDLTLIRSDEIDSERAASFFGWAKHSGVPVFASLFEWEEAQVWSLPISGKWTLITKSKPVDIWKWDP